MCIDKQRFYFKNFLDFIDVGIWEKLETIQNQELHDKACQLPKLLDAAFSEATLAKYKTAWAKWVNWCSRYSEISHCPADPFFICIYLNDLVLAKSSLGTIISTLCAIRWGHMRAGFNSPTSEPIVKLAFKGAKRLASTFSKSSKRKEPFTAELVQLIVNEYADSSNLIHLRFLIICVLGFAGFFRISELLNLKIKNLTRTENSYEIFIEESKTDQLREGNIVYIAETGNRTCPVHWLDVYLNKTKLINQPESYLICRLAKTKVGHNAIGSQAITYQTARNTFNEHLKIITSDSSTFGLHSLRSGGASAAANLGVSDRLIGKHGRWSGSTSRDVYIKDSKESRLDVGKNLGI